MSINAVKRSIIITSLSFSSRLRIALPRLPEAKSAAYLAASPSIPVHLGNASAISSAAAGSTRIIWHLDEIVFSTLSGEWVTKRNNVFSDGSSTIFSSLLEASACIFSGSQTTTALYPSENEDNDNCVRMFLASATEMLDDFFSIPRASYSSFSVKKGFFAKSSLHWGRKVAEVTFSPDTGNMKCRSG